MKQSAQLAAVALLFTAALGCEAPALPPSPEPSAPPAVEATPAVEERPIVAGVPGEPLPEIETPVTNDPRPVDPNDPIKGRRSRRAGGSLGAVAHANFYARHKIIYDQVKSNLGLYMATSADGDFPKSHEEFMEKIIKGYNMELPELEPQHEYIYVPEEAVEGLQIRLKQAESTEEAPAEAPAAEAAPAEQPAAEAAEPEPIYNIRERAAALGGQAPDVEEP